METTTITSGRAWIPEYRLDELLATLAQVNKRAAKLGCPPATHKVLGTEVRKVRSQRVLTRVFDVPFLDVEVAGEMPKLPGWALVAVVSQVAAHRKKVSPSAALRPMWKVDDQGIVDAVPGETCPTDQRKRGPICDHCGRADARRKKTMVLRHDDGTKVVQVGTTCIGAFLGATSFDPQAALMLATRIYAILRDLGDVDDYMLDGGGRRVATIDLREALILTAKVLVHEPWMSRSKARDAGFGAPPPTADTVSRLAFSDGPLDDYEQKILATAIDAAEVARAIAWVTAQGDGIDTANDYILNLLALVERGNVLAHRLGYACSILPTYRRHVEMEIERAAAANSEHFGTVGDRVVMTLTLVGMPRTVGSFRISYLHTFRDAEGRTAKWFGADRLTDLDGKQVEPGQALEVKATIKAHAEFRGAKETTLTRVVAAPPAKVKKARRKKEDAKA